MTVTKEEMAIIQRVLDKPKERRPTKRHDETYREYQSRIKKWKGPVPSRDRQVKKRVLEKVRASLDDMIMIAYLLSSQKTDRGIICDEIEKVLPVRKLSVLLENVLNAPLDRGYWNEYISKLFEGAQHALHNKRGAGLILQSSIIGDARCIIPEAVGEKDRNDLPLFLQLEFKANL